MAGSVLSAARAVSRTALPTLRTAGELRTMAERPPQKHRDVPNYAGIAIIATAGLTALGLGTAFSTVTKYTDSHNGKKTNLDG